MTLNYIGSRANKERLAEFSYENKEENRFMRIAEALRREGYDIDVGVQNWAAIKVEDRAEFDKVKRDFQRLRRKIH